jgi:type IV pilus assembly protein PilO
MAIRTGLEGKPWYIGLLVGALLGGALFFAVHLWLLKPKMQEIAREESRLAGLQAKIQEGRAAKLQLPRFREEVRQLEIELDKLLRILPARRNTPDLLRRIRSLAEQGDFDLVRFTPGDFQEKDFYVEWPIAIAVNGTYHNLALFFDRLGRFSRIVNVENLRVAGLDARRRGRADAGQTISATFSAKTFIYKDESAEASSGPAPR